MLQQENPDDYVVGTGQFHSVKDFVAESFKNIGVTDWSKYVIIDPRFKRPAEVPHLRAKTDKAKAKLGWEPKVKFEELVKMMVDADIKRQEAKLRAKE